MCRPEAGPRYRKECDCRAAGSARPGRQVYMDQGKLSVSDLRRIILDRLRITRPEVVMGARIGEDCCAIRSSDICVISTDPITAADAELGFLGIQVNANDVAAAGCEPFAALVTILLPVTATESVLQTIADEMISTAADLQIDIIGGHTEITEVVVRPVLSVTMMGTPVVPGRILTSGGMRPEDTLVMTKYAGIEGTMILADRYGRQLRDHLDESDLRQLELLHSFMSVIPEGITAAKDPHVSAMHDITEGGVIGAMREMCDASGVGAVIERGKIPVLPVTRKICSILKVDVERLMSSGSMLIAVSEQSRLMEDLAEKGIPATVIGHADQDAGLRDRATGEPLEELASDALYSTQMDSEVRT